MAIMNARLTAALDDELTARSMLNELHTQVVTCTDPNMLSTLLGQYNLLAASRVANMSQAMTRAYVSRAGIPTRSSPTQESKRLASIVKIMRAAQDAANNVINNFR